MLTIFNRRELTMTYSMSERVRICDILLANGIAYTIKTVNTTAPAMGSGRRGGSTMGISMDCAYEYRIFVHKNDLDHAAYLIRK